MSRRDLGRLYWTYRAALGVLRLPAFERYAAPDLAEDGLYALASWIVAQGRSPYMDIIEHPNHMPRERPERPYPGGHPLNEIIRLMDDPSLPENDEFCLE